MHRLENVFFGLCLRAVFCNLRESVSKKRGIETGAHILPRRAGKRYATEQRNRYPVMMIMHSAKPLLAMILLLVPLVIGAAILLKNLVNRKQNAETLPTGEASPERKTHYTLGIIEGISFLLLMGVAVPIKRMTGDATWVTIVGSLHGALFQIGRAHV